MKIVAQIAFWLGGASFVGAFILKVIHLALFSIILPVTLVRAAIILLLIAIATALIWKK